MSYNIWRYFPENSQWVQDGSSSPVGLNYKIGLNIRLHPKYTFNKGELIATEYFKGFDGTLYSELILDAKVNYVRDENGLAVSRTTIRRWTVYGSEDGTPQFGPDYKTTYKLYSPQEALAEIRRRRQNIVNNLLNLSFLGEAAVKTGIEQIMTVYENQVSSYISTGNIAIKTTIQTSTEAWLDGPFSLDPSVTIRQMILSEII